MQVSSAFSITRLKDFAQTIVQQLKTMDKKIQHIRLKKLPTNKIKIRDNFICSCWHMQIYIYSYEELKVFLVWGRSVYQHTHSLSLSRHICFCVHTGQLLFMRETDECFLGTYHVLERGSIDNGAICNQAWVLIASTQVNKRSQHEQERAIKFYLFI